MHYTTVKSMIFTAVALVGLWVTTALALGSSCSAPLTQGTAAPGDPFWLQDIEHQGIAALNPDPTGYQVFRNVKDFGAIGDGVTDDTEAINAAISSGDRCGEGCNSTTTAPALVFFPQGVYLVSAPLIAFYQTQMIGDAKVPPTLLASPGFSGIAVIDADPYLGGSAQFYINTNNFFRAVRNFIIDLRQVPGSATGLHWQVSQGTSLRNVVVEMSTASNTQHQGIFMENGSGGFMGDLVFNGGLYGIWIGNQQFTVRNITINSAQTAIFAQWNWGWTFQDVTISNCLVGFDLTTGGKTQLTQGVGAEAIIDATVSDTPTFIRASQPSNGTLHGSLVLNNIWLSNVPIAVGVKNGDTLLRGGTTTIDSWAQGDVYTDSNSTGAFIQSAIPSVNKAASLLDASGHIVGKAHPQYADFAVDQFVSVRSNGATGDGHTDDTQAIQDIFDMFAGCKIIFFDAGSYNVTSTITIPAGTQIIGEAWSAIVGQGESFLDFNNPEVVVRVGELGSEGIAEISDMIFTTRGPTAGAIVVEWNVHDPAGQQGAAGTWDTHIILGGIAGSNLQQDICAKEMDTQLNCFAAFMALHLTPSSSAYIEGLWAWLSDHDLDTPGNEQISVYSGRGIMSESLGPVWLIGTCEHHIIYQYYLNGAQDHYLGLIQTETPYFQPNPVPPAPFIPSTSFKDPAFHRAAWGLSVQTSSNILVFGAGLYSFFSDYATDCQATFDCQEQMVDLDSDSSVAIYSLSTVATTSQLSIDEEGIISSSDNLNGFAQTVTSWTRS